MEKLLHVKKLRSIFSEIKHALKNAFSNSSLRVELRRRPGIISIWIIRRQNVSTYVRRCYRNNKIGKGLERCAARVNGRQAEKEREREGVHHEGASANRPAGQVLSDLRREREREETGREKEREGKRKGEKGRDRESYYEQRLRARNCGISTVCRDRRRCVFRQTEMNRRVLQSRFVMFFAAIFCWVYRERGSARRRDVNSRECGNPSSVVSQDLKQSLRG